MKSSKNDTNYKHNLDNLIKKILSEETCFKNQLFRELQKFGFSGSKLTVHRHLLKLTRQNFIQYVKEGRKNVYSLTESTKMKSEFNINEYVKPKRRNLKYILPNLIDDKKKLYGLILFQAANGSGQIVLPNINKNYKKDWNDNTGKSLMLLNPRYYQSTIKNRNIEKYINMNLFKKIPGVTREDIISGRNLAYKDLFSDIEFSEKDIDFTLNQIKELCIGKITQIKMRDKEIAIEIIDTFVKQFIGYLEAILDAVEYRIRFSWIFVQQEPMRRSREFKWYRDLFGTGRTVDILIKQSHYKDYLKTLSDSRREKLKNQSKIILSNLDKTIVSLYDSFIRCSRLDKRFVN